MEEKSVNNINTTLTRRQMERLEKLRKMEKRKDYDDESKDRSDISHKNPSERFDQIKLYRDSIKRTIVSNLLMNSVTKSFIIYPV